MMHAKILAAVLFLAPSALAADRTWQQCGGIGYKGVMTCDRGDICQYWNDYYSQCIPAPTTTTRRTTTTTKKSTTTTKTTTKVSVTTSSTTEVPVTTTSTTEVPVTTSTTTTEVPVTSTSSTTTSTTPTSTPALEDLELYHGNALSSGWENWSWSSTFDFTYAGPPTPPAGSGGSVIQVTTGGYGGVSFRNPKGYAGYKTLVFQVAGASAWGLVADSTTEPFTSGAVSLVDSCPTPPTADAFTTCYFDIAKLGDHAWDRVTFQSWSDKDQTTYLANLFFTTKTALELTDTKSFGSGAAFGSNTLLLIGTGDITDVTVTKGGEPVAIASSEIVENPSRRVYAKLASSWAPGVYTVTHSAGVITITIPAAVTGDLSSANGTRKISKWIYGTNFPASSGFLNTYGIPLGRWGGNAMTPYNPITKYINAANDWYFENRPADNGGFESWAKMVAAGHAKAVYSIPMLDWVAKPKDCWSYSVAKYGPQDKVDPYNADAGNGLQNGTRIVNDPNDCYVPWGPSNVTAYLSSLDAATASTIEFFTIGNELDIADGTHPDIQQEKMSYDNELARVKAYGQAIRAAIPTAKILGPTSCCFWFWWHSSVGETDQAAHGGLSKLRYLLRELRAYDEEVGKKTIDYLDVHFNPQEGRPGDGSAADNASRLRSSRAWWDPTYKDESYMGQDGVYAGEENPGSVYFIRRMKKLISEEYPGLGLAVTEWYNNNDLVGGLQIADGLGIFAREGLDVATKWANTDPGSAGAAAYWLYSGGYNSAKPFPDQYLNVPIFYDPDTAAVFFAKGESNTAGVFINKNPTEYQHYKVVGWKAGTYTIRHFGTPGVRSDQGALFEATITLDASSTVVVPPYSAVFLSQ
ncbi:hypothetical protein HK097_000427 [Rhizophlyctis rosea]|uniref:CBM1 domain-containing protein n=1 Tax=Rhizophlyctis rosea TaxID=64517 RepID=A0AAD5SDM3_9FUNG|nr:hypothetical protein HK097_000427 [Rhizophlyctis rosea]